jgi:phage terminase Nu1 subunit (DNA packaging protein)
MERFSLKLINEHDAADALGVSVRTLQAWRTRGGGPPFVKLGQSVRYNTLTLIEWSGSRVRAHTGDHGAGSQPAT